MILLKHVCGELLLTEKHIAILQEIMPDVEVMKELESLREWLLVNPQSYTQDEVRHMIFDWLAHARWRNRKKAS